MTQAVKGKRRILRLETVTNDSRPRHEARVRTSGANGDESSGSGKNGQESRAEASGGGRLAEELVDLLFGLSSLLLGHI